MKCQFKFPCLTSKPKRNAEKSSSLATVCVRCQRDRWTPSHTWPARFRCTGVSRHCIKTDGHDLAAWSSQHVPAECHLPEKRKKNLHGASTAAERDQEICCVVILTAATERTQFMSGWVGARESYQGDSWLPQKTTPTGWKTRVHSV